MNAPRMEYQPGDEETRTWMKQPVKPGLIEGSPWHRTFPVTRTGDNFDVLIPAFSGSQRAHWSNQHSSIDQVRFRVFEDGELVAEGNRATDFAVSPGPSRIRMELDVAREEDWWTMSTRTSTAWELGSQRPPGGATEIVPMLLVDYDLDLDLLNSALPPPQLGGPRMLGLQIRHQPGADGPAIAGAQVWRSYDDGASWRPVGARNLGAGGFEFLLPARPPAGTEFVSLKVVAWDAGGNRIEQEIIRAFSVDPA